MNFLKFVAIDEKLEVKELLAILEEGLDIQIYFNSIDYFNKYFDKFSSILYDYAHQIKSLYCPISGNIFEDTVKIMSELEDQLEIPISHIVVESKFSEDIKQLIDFYEADLNDGSLSISIFDNNNPVETVINIERNRYQGINLCCHSHIFNTWLSDGLLKYTGSIYYFDDTDIAQPYFNKENFNGYFIKAK